MNLRFIRSTNPLLGSQSIAFFICLTSLWAQSPKANPSDGPLNVVVILTDDQAHWTIGAYGNKECPTPNMDRLAGEGALFTNAFAVSPLCSPSRASFLTGLYPTQAGISDVLYWTFMKTMLPPEVYESEIRRGLEASTITWPELLQDRGYQTALIGKWHLGVQAEHHPNQHGFDYYFGPYLAGEFNLTRPTLQENGERQVYEQFMTDVFADKAIEFIGRNRDKPFAILFAPQAPHAPWKDIPEGDIAPLLENPPSIPPEAAGPGDDRLRRFMRDYLGLVRVVDRNLGRILDSLETHDLAHRTAVIFTSDHGLMMGHRNLLGKGTATFFAGGKFGPRRMNMFDLSLRVPLMIRWPGVTEAGMQVTQLVSHLDLFPTIFSMLNLRAPESVGFEGRDMSPLLRGERTSWRDSLYGQLDVERNGFALMRMIRTEQWKLVRHHLPLMMDELYDLESDPNELRNLYRNPEYRDRRERLQGRLSRWQQSIKDPVFRVEKAVHAK